MNSNRPKFRVAIIGAGFCGLAAAYEFCKRGAEVTVFEQEQDIGGLAGSFIVNGVRLEKFYHHWFTSDYDIMQLVEELGGSEDVLLRESRTGMYYAHNFFKLSSPLDVLRFHPLRPLDRLRLGMLALRARRVYNWRSLEHLSAKEWLLQIGGRKVYEIVWEPLLRGKFGQYAEDVSAVWFWNKLKLRGGSRGNGGREQLAYYRGGFAALADRLATNIQQQGGRIFTGANVHELQVSCNRITGVIANSSLFPTDTLIATPALPIVAKLLDAHLPKEYLDKLRRIRYLGNLCIVLELQRSLSDTYWLNVNDPSFPFVGVVEHTNFESSSTYGGSHIVYLSKYLAETEELFSMEDSALMEYTLPHLQRMFPQFTRDWIRKVHVWRARYSQPVVERNYTQLIPSHSTPLKGLYLASMAQVYPEDRGTNYAVREGRHIAALVCESLSKSAESTH